MSDYERSALGDLAVLRRSWTWARPDAWAFAVALLLTPAIAGLSLAQPWLLKVAIDEHIVPGRLPGLRGVAFAYLGAVVAAYALEGTYSLALSWGGQRTILRLRRALYAHTLSLSQSFFDRQPAGKLLTRITNDVESLGEALAAGVVTIALDVLVIAGTLGAMLWLDARLTIVLLLGAPPLVAVLEALRRRLRALYMEIREAQAAVNAFLAERIDGVEVVQLMSHEAASADAFDGHSARFNRACKASNVYDAAMFAVVDGSVSVFVAVMIAYGMGLGRPWLERAGLGWLAGDAVTVGLLVAFMEYLERLFRPLRELSGKIAIIQRAMTALSKILWLFDEGERQPEGGVAIPAVRGRIALRGVRFRYRPDTPEVLGGIDLDVLPGESVALVGPTGSGKTTLTRLLDRSYAGYEGSIEIDGQELSGLDPAALRRRVATVRQDIQVFSETIRFNVDLGNPAIGDAAREEAARLVHADRFVEPLGWAHLLRERGADLSVGEGQLLTFARTMAHDPDVVILDEATASVDTLTEALIRDATRRILERKTVIVVAHRLSTVQHVDRIVVMEGGRIVEQGSHEALLARGGRYAAMVRAGEGVVADVE